MTKTENAERALDAVKGAYPGELDDVTVEDLGDVAGEQVADLITDLLLLVDAAGEDVDEVLDRAQANYWAEKD